MSRWLWYLTEIGNKLWFRASIYAVIAVATALISIFAREVVPADIPQKIGANAVDDILNILASSMLAVTIFSVSTMVSAYSAATSNVTPRATKLLIEDKFSHSALSTFIGSFIFSIVGIITLKTGAYGEQGRLILFVVTILMIALIVVTLLRWVEYLSRLGRVGETIERVEQATANALIERIELPCLGGTPYIRSAEHPEGKPVFFKDTGYVHHIDIKMLSGVAEKNDAKIFVNAMPGKLVDPYTPLAYVQGDTDQEDLKKITKAFIMGHERSYRQDPRFGFAVLSEIAIRALSPAVNDPGTAIYVLGAGLRTLLLWLGDEDSSKEVKIKYPRIYVTSLDVDDMFDDFFSPIIRDGAANLQVAIRMQKAFLTLSRTQNAALVAAAGKYSHLSLQHSLADLKLKEDKEKLIQIAAKVTKA